MRNAPHKHALITNINKGKGDENTEVDEKGVREKRQMAVMADSHDMKSTADSLTRCMTALMIIQLKTCRLKEQILSASRAARKGWVGAEYKSPNLIINFMY
jgi:hypothetical protein